MFMFMPIFTSKAGRIRSVIPAGLSRGLLLLAAVAAGSGLRAEVVTFEDLTVPASGFFNGDPGGLSPGDSVGTPWTTQGVSFSNTYGVDASYAFPYWYGFAYSNVVNTTDVTFGNQYASYPGGGYQSANYAVAYSDGATITLPSASALSGFRIANTTYAYGAMMFTDPYNFSTPLGPGSWFSVTAAGSLGGRPTGSLDYYLADLRTPTSPGVLAGWAWFDLSSLGVVDSVSFSFAGSDIGDYGLNTPAYFAMDNLTVAPVPEPATHAMLAAAALAALGGGVARRRWRIARGG